MTSPPPFTQLSRPRRQSGVPRGGRAVSQPHEMRMCAIDSPVTLGPQVGLPYGDHTPRHLPVHGVPERQVESGESCHHACMHAGAAAVRDTVQYIVVEGGGKKASRRPAEEGQGEGRIENLPSVPCSTCKRVGPCWLVESPISSTSFDHGCR